MINPATGEPDPCPMCGSTNVRWRGRRFYDVPFNFVRYMFDRGVGGLFGTATGVSRAPGRAWGPSAQDRLTAREYRLERTAYEDRADAATPVRFWHCHACHRRGEDFGNLAEKLEPQREDLVSMEDELVRDRYALPNDPINRAGVPNHEPEAREEAGAAGHE